MEPVVGSGAGALILRRRRGRGRAARATAGKHTCGATLRGGRGNTRVAERGKPCDFTSAILCPIHVYNMQEDVTEYAKFLGMDVDADAHLLWIAKEAMEAPLPEGWTQHEDKDGFVYFYNTGTQQSTYEHPMDEFYRKVYAKVRRVGLHSMVTQAHSCTALLQARSNKSDADPAAPAGGRFEPASRATRRSPGQPAGILRSPPPGSDAPLPPQPPQVTAVQESFCPHCCRNPFGGGRSRRSHQTRTHSGWHSWRPRTRRYASTRCEGEMGLAVAPHRHTSQSHSLKNAARPAGPAVRAAAAAAARTRGGRRDRRERH